MEFQGKRSEEKSNNIGNGYHGIRKDDRNSSQMPRKPYQRYSAQQVVRMREFYMKNTHPDDNERKALGKELGLDPLRVKVWFQNRRSQNKKKDDNLLNMELREENERLHVDNEMLKHVLGSPICKNCGGSSTYEISATRMLLLRVENEFMKAKIHKVTQLMEEYCRRGVLSHPLYGTTSSTRTSNNKGNASGSAAQD